MFKEKDTAITTLLEDAHCYGNYKYELIIPSCKSEGTTANAALLRFTYSDQNDDKYTLTHCIQLKLKTFLYKSKISQTALTRTQKERIQNYTTSDYSNPSKRLQIWKSRIGGTDAPSCRFF